MNKALARPTVELAMPSRVSPLTTTLSSDPYTDASIVYLAGNLHDQRKAGGLRFTTFSARDNFVELVLRGIRAPPRIREVGQRLAKRMTERVNGRRWVAAHLRRGDFVNIAWSPAKDALVHFDKTKKALDRGVGVLKEHFDSRLPLGDDPWVCSLVACEALPAHIDTSADSTSLPTRPTRLRSLTIARAAPSCCPTSSSLPTRLLSVGRQATPTSLPSSSSRCSRMPTSSSAAS